MCCTSSRPSQAFSYVVQADDTLAGLAQRFYGKVQHETVLVVANRLDRGPSTRIVPGMILEVPALRYERVQRGDDWEELALRWLGHRRRSVVLSQANGSKPWLPLEEGGLVIVPYNLQLTATGRETLSELAQRFLGDDKKAWSLAHYNDLEHARLEPGRALLIPLLDLKLTALGEMAARAAALATERETAGPAHESQQKAGRELPRLVKAVKSGRYVEAVAQGAALLAAAQLTNGQRAAIQRQLVEAYVALNSTGRAVFACQQWLELEPGAKLDAEWTSPKVLHACEKAAEILGRRP